MKTLTPEHVQTIRDQIKALPDDASNDQIEKTAHRLESITYQPMLIVEPPDFLRITKKRLLAFIDNLVANPGETELTEQHLNLLLHHYQLLQRLRRDEPEAWNDISELMEED
ncbi:MAG: hypothetical protein ACOCWJ_03125 [Verrucomicrobiota bacterium]